MLGPSQVFVVISVQFRLLWLSWYTKSNRATPASYSQAFQCNLGSKLRYLWFPSIVLSNRCQTIFTLREPNQRPFSCQQQQLPWQHTGRSTLWEWNSPLKRAIRTFCTLCSTVCTHMCMRVGVLLE